MALSKLLVLLVLALASLLTLSSPRAEASTPAPAREHVSSPVVPTGGAASVLGVGMLGAEMNPALVALAPALGARWARVYIQWSHIQSLPGCTVHCAWSSTDSMLANIRAAGLEPIVTIIEPPCWASTHCTTDGGPLDLPGGLDAFQDFVTSMANRYNDSQPGLPVVHYYEINNEPDDNVNFGSGVANPNAAPNYLAPGPQAYAQELLRAGPAIHNANPGHNSVVFGGIAHEYWTDIGLHGGGFDMQFVDEVAHYLSVNGTPDAAYFDVMNYHYFDAFASEYSPANVVGKALKVKADSAALDGLPFMVTEVGAPWGMDPASCDTNNPILSHTTAAQAITRMLAQMAAGATYGVQFLAETLFSYDHYSQGLGPMPCAASPAPALPRTLGTTGTRAGAPSWSCTPGQVCEFWGLLDSSNSLQPTEAAALQTLNGTLTNATYAFPLSGAPSNIQGYTFSAPLGQTRTILWNTNLAGLTTVSFAIAPGARILESDMLGVTTILADGASGDLDSRAGWVGIGVGAGTVYVEDPYIPPATPTRLYFPIACSNCP